MIIAMAQGKGGCFKSTCATNLAAYLAHKGHKVGLLDTDPQGTAHKWNKRRLKYSPDKPQIELKRAQQDIRDTVDAMYNRNDYLIIDTAGYDSKEARQAFVAADITVSPYRHSQNDLEQAPGLVERLELSKSTNQKLVCLAVLWSCSTNKHETRTDKGKTFLSEFNIFKIMDSTTKFRESWRDCVDDGLGVIEYHDSKAKSEMIRVAEELLSYD